MVLVNSGAKSYIFVRFSAKFPHAFRNSLVTTVNHTHIHYVLKTKKIKEENLKLPLSLLLFHYINFPLLYVCAYVCVCAFVLDMLLNKWKAFLFLCVSYVLACIRNLFSCVFCCYYFIHTNIYSDTHHNCWGLNNMPLFLLYYVCILCVVYMYI